MKVFVIVIGIIMCTHNHFSIISEWQQGLYLQPGHEPVRHSDRVWIHREGAPSVGPTHLPKAYEAQGPHRECEGSRTQ